MKIHTYKDGLMTERLYTRFLVADDYKTWAKFLEDKEATEFIFNPWNAATHGEHARFWIEKQLLRYKEKRGGLQALINKGTGEFIGQCGLLLQEIDGKQEIEVGYHIFRKYWGQGYAPEAAKAFFDFGFVNNIAPSFISIIDVKNIKSQRVAEKNGLKIDKQTRWMDLDVFIYRLENP